MTKTKKVFKSYSDSQHGWIAVKRKFLIELGIADKITMFSYQRGLTVYVEEDQDASTFVNAYRNKYKSSPTFDHHSTDNSHPIRSYERYSQE